MEASVVIIENSNKEILLLRRNFSPLGWCLPGGKVEKEEEVLDAAVREVFEETGIKIFKENTFYIKQCESINKNTIVHVFKSYVKDPKVIISKEHSNYLWTNILLPEIPLAGNTSEFLYNHCFINQ